MTSGSWHSLLVAALCAISASASAASWVVQGRVVGVSDGDTFTLLDRDNRQHKIRLAGIDAPEKGQAFGEQSRQNLAALAFQRDARADCDKTDRFGREVCKVWVQPPDCPRCGMTLDVGHAQVIVGLAWWFRRYANEQSPDDRGRYESDETEARLRKRGLWHEKQPVPPWDWRKSKRVSD